MGLEKIEIKMRSVANVTELFSIGNLDVEISPKLLFPFTRSITVEIP